MTLKCKEVNLWDMPAYIANMCYYCYNEDGHQVPDNWKSILFRYSEWIEGQLSKSFKTVKAYIEKERAVDVHLAELLRFKELHFYLENNWKCIL